MLRYSNNAVANLTQNVDVADTTLHVASTAGFPQGVDFSGGDYYYVTIANALSRAIEICKVVGATPVSFTVERAQQGTLAAVFAVSGTTVERRATAADYDNFVQDEELVGHLAAADPHPQYATDTDLVNTVNAHLAAADPHPQYVQDGELNGAITAHEAKPDPHPLYAFDTDVTAAITAHVALPDPHSQYATNASVDTRIAQHEAKANPHPTYLKAATNADITAKTSNVVGITPAGIDHLWGRFLTERGVTISQGASSAGKLPILNAAGKLDTSIVPTAGGTTFRGTVDAVNNPPPSAIYYAGDFYYHVGVTGVIDPNWNGAVGTTIKTGDQIVYNGTGWSVIPALNDSDLFLYRDGSNSMTGPLNMDGNSLQNGIINCGTF